MSNPAAEWVPLLAGLVAAAVLSGVACRVPHSGLSSWHAVLISASWCVLAAFLAGAIGDSILRLALSGVTAVGGRALRTACIAVWFAPLSLFMQEQSSFGMAVAAALAMAATLSVTHESSSPGEIQHSPSALLANQVFVAFEARPLVQELLPAFCVVACAEAALVAQMINHPVIAAGLAAASAGVLARCLVLRILPPKRRWSAERGANSLTVNLPGLALLVTIAALLPFLRGGIGFGARSANHRLHRIPSAAGPAGQEKTSAGGYSSRGSLENAAEDLGGGYSGIILWPESQKVVKLVAPPVPGRLLTFGSRAAAPFSIPFNGVYWVFKWPDARPPGKSHVAQGSLEEFNIRSTDERPLRVEAHQNLGTLIDLSCCRAIQVGIRNADRYLGTVSLELSLRNTTLPGKPLQPLGTATVNSTRPWALYGERPAVRETLNFNIPDGFALRQFDEVTIAFQLSPTRSNFSAKVGIEKFTLIPHGQP